MSKSTRELVEELKAEVENRVNGVRTSLNFVSLGGISNSLDDILSSIDESTEEQSSTAESTLIEARRELDLQKRRAEKAGSELKLLQEAMEPVKLRKMAMKEAVKALSAFQPLSTSALPQHRTIEEVVELAQWMLGGWSDFFDQLTSDEAVTEFKRSWNEVDSMGHQEGRRTKMALERVAHWMKTTE